MRVLLFLVKAHHGMQNPLQSELDNIHIFRTVEKKGPPALS